MKTIKKQHISHATTTLTPVRTCARRTYTQFEWYDFDSNILAFATTIGTPKETTSARYCLSFTLKLLSVTFGHVSRRAHQKMPPYYSMWSTPTILISSVHLGHSSTTLSASLHHAWQRGHSPSTVRKQSAQVSADM